MLKQINLEKEKEGHKLTRGSLLTKNFVFSLLFFSFFLVVERKLTSSGVHREAANKTSN